MSDFTLMQRARRKISDYLPTDEAALTIPGGALSITFDDFPKSSWTIAGKILAEHDIRATYYFSGGLAGTTYRDLPHFDAKDLVGIHDAGHEIGCHTFDHLSALRDPAGAFFHSIERNRDFLAGVLPGYTMRTFAYPFGDVCLSAKRRLRTSFSASRGIYPGLNGLRTELTNLRAIPLEDRQRGSFDFAHLIAEAAEHNRWIIIFTHDVAAKPSPYGCRPEDLASVITRAKSAGLLIEPVSTVLDRARAN